MPCGRQEDRGASPSGRRAHDVLDGAMRTGERDDVGRTVNEPRPGALD
jgi:hypothetical protein